RPRTTDMRSFRFVMVAFAGFTAILGFLATTDLALAQENLAAPIESGKNGFAGMFAGLLVVALAALGFRHRRNEAMKKRIAELETALEERDDKLWMLEEQLARA